MRTNEEQNECINILIERVQALEAEVERLKGEPLAKETLTAQQNPPGMNISRPSPPPKSRQKESSGKLGDSSLENAIGTRWIGRIGILAILFGIAFFLKYSFDNKLIGETGRVILGIFWGAAFIGIGEYLQKKKNMGLYGQMLSGGGLAVLYLALYAAFAFYHLIPALLAATGMLAVTTTGMTLSIRYSTYSLSAIALAGGFLTPFMLSTGQNQPLTLFGYILLLDSGTFLLLRFRRWPSLAAASLLGTVLLYFCWQSEFFNDSQRWLAFGIILVFFIFFNLYIIISRFYSQNTESKIDQIIICGSAAFFFLAFFSQYHWEPTWPVKVFTLILAGFEIGMAWFVRGRTHAAHLTIATYGTVSIIMTTITIFIALGQRWILPALAAEMTALGLIGLRLDFPILRRGTYVLGLIVLLRFTIDIKLRLEPFERFIPIFNSRFLVCAAAVAGFYILMSFILRYRDKLETHERYILVIIFIISQALSLILLSAEVYSFFRFQSPRYIPGWGISNYAYQLSLSVLWAFYASILTAAGILKRLRPARVMGILLLGLTVLKVFLVDLSALQTFYRIISFIVLGLLLLAVSYGYNRFKHFIFGEDQL